MYVQYSLHKTSQSFDFLLQVVEVRNSYQWFLRCLDSANQHCPCVWDLTHCWVLETFWCLVSTILPIVLTIFLNLEVAHEFCNFLYWPRNFLDVRNTFSWYRVQYMLWLVCLQPSILVFVTHLMSWQILHARYIMLQHL